MKYPKLEDLLQIRDNYVVDPERKAKEDLLDAISLTESSGGKNGKENHRLCCCS